ncbi:DsbA family oxidoreductase [Roseisolibacter sp. H3M3-2]|uniref:DsbA family oxidoreductase n=1 Tax=Roseisolibacter sp. H3M3-2 TaxID=3031323 RepID=UPI0023DBA1AC|nr:DsbA family oxidoreductase [Roseisolibacter sp. H3M3-2]MDF1503579.1 DsbA family oxidoreductase [Roseisolibacter sp. H3M3-2]
MTRTLAIDVWADVACPWCWIGERRLRGALARLAARRPEVAVEARWRPYQLQPQLPREGADWATFVQTKFGGEARAAGMFDHVARAGEGEGLRFRFDRVAVAPNTADAHRLILRAGERALDAADALFQAYFAEGRNVSDRGQLADLAVHWGLPREEALAFLDSDEGELEVQGAMREARRLGIQGVPFVVLDGRLAISGAQPAELFDRALEAALAGG